MNIQVTSLGSSNIEELVYIGEHKVLGVVFVVGSHYIYKDVELSVVLEILAASSIGKKFSAEIAKNPDRYKYAKISKKEFSTLLKKV